MTIHQAWQPVRKPEFTATIRLPIIPDLYDRIHHLTHAHLTREPVKLAGDDWSVEGEVYVLSMEIDSVDEYSREARFVVRLQQS